MSTNLNFELNTITNERDILNLHSFEKLNQNEFNKKDEDGFLLAIDELNDDFDSLFGALTSPTSFVAI